MKGSARDQVQEVSVLSPAKVCLWILIRGPSYSSLFVFSWGGLGGLQGAAQEIRSPNLKFFVCMVL